MKQFIIRFLIVAGIILLISALFLRILVSFPNNTFRETHEINVIRQIERMQKIDGPKIIFIGGSGCGFGLCSSMINDYFGMPVCNTGTMARIGLLTQLQLCKDFIHQNDIVVVIPEYENYFGNYYLGNETTLRVLTTFYPQGYKHFTLRQQFHLLRYVPKAFNDVLTYAITRRDSPPSSKEATPYSACSLNDFGDVEMYEKRQHIDLQEEPKVFESLNINKKVVHMLQDYYQYCKSQNATMLLFPPAYKAMNYDVNKNTICTIWMVLKKAHLPLVSCPEHYRMPDMLHYDSEYHLTYEGVMIRTKKLIADMDCAIDSSVVYQ